MKINKETLEVELDTQEADIPFEELADLLPAAAPRYFAYSYKYVHKEGDHERISYPLVFVFYCPPGINPHDNMMYASTKQTLANALEIQKVFIILFSFPFCNLFIFVNSYSISEILMM